MHRTSKGGSYRIDRVFPGVGRIAVASGATTAGEFDKRDALLTRLYDRGRLDLLDAIKKRRYTVTEVYAADQQEDGLKRLTGERAILARPLWKAVEDWLGPKKDRAPTPRRYGVSFDALKARAGLPETTTIEALGSMDWNALKARWPKSDGDWFHLRAAVSHFLAVQLGNGKPKKGVHHPWRVAVMDTENFPFARAAERVPDVTPDLFWRIVHATPEFVRAAYVTIAALGLRVGEYLRLRDQDRRVGRHVEGGRAALAVGEGRGAVPAPVQVATALLGAGTGSRRR
jgi:hypothetical protein